jgi:hypothetical protein
LPVNTYMAEVTKSSDRQDLDAVLDALPPAGRVHQFAEHRRAREGAGRHAGLDGSPLHQRPAKVLMSMGFTYLDRVEIDGRKSRYWSQEPERFMRDGECDPQLIREALVGIRGDGSRAG